MAVNINKESKPFVKEKNILSYLADGLKLFIFRIIAGQQISAIRTSALAFSQVTANHHYIQCISYTSQIIFLQL